MGSKCYYTVRELEIGRKELIHKLIEARYERNDITLSSGSFRVKGDTIDIIPGYSDDVIRVSLLGSNRKD